MAILNDLIVRGATRCLNTLYANSLQVDSQTISGNLTVNGYTYMGYSTSRSDTKLSVAGITNNQWYRSTGNVGWYNDSHGGGIYMTDSTYVKTYNNKAFYAYNGLYTGSTQQYYLDVNGKLNASDGVFSNNLNVGISLVSRNISATNLLRAAKYDLQTITQVGSNGTLYVAPSIQFPTSNTTSVAAASTSITIIDTNITSDVMAGVVWRPSAKVKISGTINGVVTGTVDGTITSINTSSKTMVIGNLSGGNWSSVVAGTYTKDKIENLNIMMYETYQNSTYYPVGILLTSYGSVSEHTDGTAKTFIDIYGGSATKPAVRLGNMTGLDAINGVTPSGWGLYTSNGYFSGLIVSTSGKIGGWSLSTNSLTTGTWGSSGSAMLCTGSTTQKAIGGSPASTSGWVFTAGENFGVTSSGALYANSAHISGEITATSGTIGGFQVGNTAIYTGTLTSATDNYIGLSTADFTRSIGGTSRTGLRMAIGDKFGVTGDGIVYSSNLQTTGGNIGGWVINSTSLYKNSTQKQTEGYIQYGAILQAPTESAIESASGSVAFGVRQRTYTDGAYGSWTYPFIVHYDGSLKATNANISGKITATSGSINGSLVTSGINANNITAGTISIERLTSIKVGGRNLLLNTAISEENLDKIHATENYCSVVTEDNKTVYKLTGYNTIHLFNNTNSWDCTSEKLEANTTYTYSAMIKCNKSVDFNFSSLGHFNVSNSNSTQNDKTHEDIVSERIYTPSTITANQWTKISITFTTNNLSGSSFGIYPIYNTGVDTILYIYNCKLEKGNKATDWTPAPEDLQTDINLALSQSVEYIIGTQTATTSSWTGTSSTLTELKDGTQIRYWLPYAGSGNATLNLTLKDGTTTGAINIYRQGGSANSSGVVTANRVTTHYPAGSSISMIYGVNRVVSAVYSGTTYTGTFTGWFVDSAYDSGNTYNRVRMQNAIKAVTAITSGRIICGTDSGYKNISVNTSFDLSYPLLYAASGINVNATGDNNYLQINGVNASSNGTIASGAVNKMLYLKGTVNGNEFTIAPSPFMTTVTPTAVDNYVYIPLGIMYSATSIYFISSDKLYAFKDGSFRELSRGEASLAAKTATNYIYYDTTNGLIISDSASSQTYAGASQGYNTQLTNNALNIRNGTTVLASYGADIILGNTIPTTEIPTPVYAKFSPKSMELYQSSGTTSDPSKLFNVGYGQGLAREIESANEFDTYVTTEEDGTIASASYTSQYDMVASNPPIIVQLRATIRDTDASTDDESTDATTIEPSNNDDSNYEGLLVLNTDYTVDYNTDTITLITSNSNNKTMKFISKYCAKYNIYIWVSYLAKNSDRILHYDLGIRKTNVTYGRFSFITGENNIASNSYGISMGWNNRNEAFKAITCGSDNFLQRGANSASVFGEGLKTIRQGSMVIGRYNAYDNGLFVVGNGTDNSNRQDAFVIRDRGKVYIYGNYAALSVTPNNTDSNKKNGGMLNLQPSLNHNTLKGYTLKNDAGRLAIYSTPARDTTLAENKDYGMSLYIKSYYVIPSSSVHTGAQYKGTLSGQYDIMTSGYATTSLTANSTYIDSSYSENLNKMYRKNGVVAIELEFRAKAAATAWTTIYTVPIGFRPFMTHRNTVQGTTFQVTGSGNVQISTALVKNTVYHLHIVYPCVVPDVTES